MVRLSQRFVACGITGHSAGSEALQAPIHVQLEGAVGVDVREEALYRDSGSLLYQTGAFLLDGKVEQHPRRGFSFVVERIADLAAVLKGAEDEPVRITREAALPGSGDRTSRGKGSRKAG